MLCDTVVHLDPAAAVFEAMVEGWARQQRTRFLNEKATIGPRLALVRRLAKFTNAYPWQWQPGDAEDFIVALRSSVGRRPIVMSTARGYEVTITLVTERSSRMTLRGINIAFEQARAAAGLPAELDLHCLRHSYITHLVEIDYPERFVSEQAGHRYTSTTAIYTGVSDEYRNRLVRRSLEGHTELWEDTRDQENGLPVEAAHPDGRAGDVPDQ